MVRVGLVAYVEEQLERDIARGRLPRDGRLASERMLARYFGVSRGTVREALRRLAARGLVVQRAGRQTRAVALDESLTLENLGLALHDARSEECRRLLEGFFSLKRQVLVDLLADCCANASAVSLELLEGTCFQLWDAARWHPGERCAQLEFELMRQAAQAAARPGHLLLIQSLQRAFRGISARLLPFMGGEPLREWAICASHALGERDMQALQHQLPLLLKACDERVLDPFAPCPQEPVASEVPHAQACLLGEASSATATDAVPETLPGIETDSLAAAAGSSEATGSAAPPRGDALRLEPDSRLPVAPQSTACEAHRECTRRDLTNRPPGDLSDRRRDCDTSPPDGGLQSETLPIASLQTHEAVRNEAGAVHGASDVHPPRGWWAARLWLLHCLRPRSTSS
ncbi:GntR family transcriptional regulator [Corallococcus exercitus]|uniref:FadR/GntR family transcriptional regulator n=1 Tax=Corallococcus exercitus TaxID=2316736 RepID=UPI000EA2B0C3|nr:GntR family transcriptional regulator [Corallococcus exercitus]RKG68467.1 GntR family transcriptional regulator [Corallococcus exercitus]